MRFIRFSDLRRAMSNFDANPINSLNFHLGELNGVFLMPIARKLCKL